MSSSPGWTRSASGLLIRDNGTAKPRRSALNLHAGTGISLTVADDPSNDETDVTITASGGGGGGFPTFSGASLTKSATQTAASSSTTIVTFNGESYDTDAFHDNATNTSRLTAPVTGHYLVGGSVAIGAAATTAGGFIVNLLVNGSSINPNTRNRIPVDTANSLPAGAISQPLSLTASDYVEISVFNGSASSATIRTSTDGTSFWIFRVA